MMAAFHVSPSTKRTPSICLLTYMPSTLKGFDDSWKKKKKNLQIGVNMVHLIKKQKTKRQNKTLRFREGKCQKSSSGH